MSFNFLSKKLYSAHSSKKYLPDNILAFSEFLLHFLCFYLYFVLYISVLRMFRITPPPPKKRREMIQLLLVMMVSLHFVLFALTKF